jgi:sortase (surface protein transpeptidase)
MTDMMRSRTARRALAVVASVMAVGGAVLLVAALRGHNGPPAPPRSAAGVLYRPSPSSSSTSSTSSTIPTPPIDKTTTTAVGAPPTAAPVAVSIPSIGVQSFLVRLGLNPDGSLQVPTSFHVAGWFVHSVAPGAVGPAVIVGHVDSKSGPGIFYKLGDLRPGDHVDVARADGTTAHFAITAVRQYSKAQFPTLAVYGNTPTPTIRLITCGGAFDNATGHYVDNTIVWGQLIS